MDGNKRPTPRNARVGQQTRKFQNLQAQAFLKERTVREARKVVYSSSTGDAPRG